MGDSRFARKIGSVIAYTGKVFSWEHNGVDPITERLTWLTDKIEHRDSSEQRRQVRLDPRRQLEYSILPLSAQERASLDLFLWGNMGGATMLPIWTDQQVLQVQANSGQAVVSVPTATYDFDNGYYCCLWRDWNLYEVVQIASFTSSAITLSENLVSTWPVGTVVMPARLARVAFQQSSNRFGCDVDPWRATFNIDESSRSTNRVTALSPTQHKSVDIYPSDSDFSEAQSMDLAATFGTVDAQTGIVAIDSAAKLYPSTIFQYSDKFFSRADISSFFGFLDRRQGCRVPFWLSTNEADFVVTAREETGPLGQGWLSYLATGFDGFWNGNIRNAILIRYLQAGAQPIGTEYYQQINDADSPSAGVERIKTLVSVIDSADIGKFRTSFLRYCRLEADTVEISWLGGCGASVKFVVRELPNYPV